MTIKLLKEILALHYHPTCTDFQRRIGYTGLIVSNPKEEQNIRNVIHHLKQEEPIMKQELCHTCIFYSEDYYPDENHTENNCDELCIDNFLPRTECPNYININDELSYQQD